MAVSGIRAKVERASQDDIKLESGSTARREGDTKRFPFPAGNTFAMNRTP
jgi:hypothetical protein